MMENRYFEFDGIRNMRRSDWEKFRKVSELIKHVEDILTEDTGYINRDLQDLIVPVSNYINLIVALNGMVLVDSKGDILDDSIDWGLVNV